MTRVSQTIAFRSLVLGLCAAGVLAVTGCGQPDARFKLSGIALLETREANPTEEVPVQDISDALAALLGTPDDPNLPAGLPEEVAGLLDINKLQQAAGPVVTDEDGLTVSGLYRQHCAHCHGLSGDGAGPTAPFLNPYPRDYRLGIFKFKSTPLGSKPTDEDMHRILIDGIPGTAMPSFKLLESREIDALVEYVKYLTIRGEVETALFEEVEFGSFTTESQVLLERTAQVMQEWVDAEDAAEPVPPPSEDFDWENAIARGEALYYTAEANCYSCHGPTQLGDGTTTNYDDWNQWALLSGTLRPLEDTYQKDDEGNYKLDDNGQRIISSYGLDTFEANGALPPRMIIPRNFRRGVFRFGRRPIDIYQRVWHGIDGVGMPGNDTISVDDKWYLVLYVRSLQYEALSEPEHFDLENLRERM